MLPLVLPALLLLLLGLVVVLLLLVPVGALLLPLLLPQAAVLPLVRLQLLPVAIGATLVLAIPPASRRQLWFPQLPSSSGTSKDSM